MKDYSFQAFFTVLDSADVIPPIVAGTEDTCWIRHTNKNVSELKRILRDRMMKLYGVKITNISFNAPIEH